MKQQTPAIIRLEAASDRLFIIAHNVQRQVTGSERTALLAQLANATAMVTTGGWTTWAVSA
jgi:hypothetical protein